MKNEKTRFLFLETAFSRSISTKNPAEIGNRILAVLLSNCKRFGELLLSQNGVALQRFGANGGFLSLNFTITTMALLASKTIFLTFAQ